MENLIQGQKEILRAEEEKHQRFHIVLKHFQKYNWLLRFLSKLHPQSQLKREKTQNSYLVTWCVLNWVILFKIQPIRNPRMCPNKMYTHSVTYPFSPNILISVDYSLRISKHQLWKVSKSLKQFVVGDHRTLTLSRSWWSQHECQCHVSPCCLVSYLL